MNKGDIVYYARVHPETGIYDVCELRVRTVYDNGVFVGTDKDTRQAFMLNMDAFGETIFDNRKMAVDIVTEAKKSAKEFTIDKGED